MNEIYKSANRKIPKLLERLLEKAPISGEDLYKREIPRSGVYVFFENRKAIYVGRSNRMKERLREHSSVSADHYSATLAFKIAKQEYLSENPELKRPRNKELMAKSDFLRKFKAAKERISKSKIRFIKLKDQIEQSLFEIYTHLELKTKYNDFRTH
ncbi:MAG: GIY-YIG nuclease family protein [Dehalococcoidales bacterium]|nr:GIY-YIG nuclease family protein [Dehalococcoidales bacterium]